MSCLTALIYRNRRFDAADEAFERAAEQDSHSRNSVLTIPGLSALRGLDAADGPSRCHISPRTGTQKMSSKAGIPRRAEAPTTARIAAGCVTRHIVTRKLPIERAIEPSSIRRWIVEPAELFARVPTER